MTQIELHCGDCLEVLKTLESESVDLVVTSPPYNIGIAYNTYDDSKPWHEYVDWCLDWGRELSRVLRQDGSLFLNLGNAPKTPYFSQKLMLAFVEGAGKRAGLFHLQNHIHWIKSISVETRGGEQLSVGHFKPINSKRFINDCHEDVYHFTKSGKVAVDRKGAGVPYADKSNINRWGHTGGEDKRCRGNNWFIPYETIKARVIDRPHPASFPPALVEQCIKLHGKGSETVLLEPFLGIGSAGIAAKRQEIRQFIGIELDEEYYQVAMERIEESSPQGCCSRPGGS